MTDTASQLRSLPPVDDVLQHPAVRPLIAERGRNRVLELARDELAHARSEILQGNGNPFAGLTRPELTDILADCIVASAAADDSARIGRVINATGVVLHTGLGRAPLSASATAALSESAAATNVEVDLETGERRYRGYQLEAAWHTLTGAEASLVVNNNAAATLLALQALCRGREVIISRGQLIEIGGSFRLPEIFELSGAVLKEVGTTNRTHPADYERAIGPETAAIMRVHPSNYQVVGFAETPGVAELGELARRHNLLMIDDIGSGALIDTARLGLPPEPTFQQSIAAGADVVMGSGDKLLGGPQCGILLGRSGSIDQLRQHPLARAVRVGKLTLAALSATLDSYLRGSALDEIPTLALLAVPLSVLRQRAQAIRDEMAGDGALEIEVRTDVAAVGGGASPTAQVPTAVLAVTHRNLSADELSRRLRTASIRVYGRIQDGAVLLDLRSVMPEDDSRLLLALRLLSDAKT